MPIVVDTSVAIKWVVTEEYTDNAQALLDDYQRRNDPILVPSLFLYEAPNVLYGFVREGALTMKGCLQAIRDLARLVQPLSPDARMMIRAITIAHALGTKETYDAHFLALAQRTQSVFWTADERFCRAARKRVTDLATTIEMIATYPVPHTSHPAPPNSN